MKLVKVIIINILCFITLINPGASSFGSDAGGVNVDFGGGRGAAVSGALSGLAGVKVSLYNTNSNTFNYSFAITNSGTTRSNALSEVKKINGTSINVELNSWYELSSKWAGSDNGGFSYNASNVKKNLCGLATGNGCDATNAFYIIANKLTTASGLGCYMEEDSNGNLNLSNSCQQTLSKYRIILEPVYAFGVSTNYTFFTLKGIGAKGVSDGVTRDPHYGMYISHALSNAQASERHGNINGLPATSTIADKYSKLASLTTGFGYNIFYLIPNQIDVPAPSADEITDPSKTLKDNDVANEKLICDNTLNALYLTSEYSYEENSSIHQTNPYCNVTCETNITVNYPNVFTVTPAGQNFELIYEPTINASKTCHTKFNYEQWETNYNAAIKYEKQALDNYNYAVALKERADSITYNSVGECGCYSCGTKDNPKKCCPDTLWEITAESVDYKTTDSVTSKSTVYSINTTYCDKNGSVSDYIETTYEEPAETTLTEAEKTLKDRAQDRLNLEKYNLQCYTSLDSANASSTIKNGDIFSEGYNTYKDTTGKPYNYNHETTTNLETLDSVSSGTSETYSDYIPNATIKIETGIIERKSTLDLFKFEPSLKFTYENGIDDEKNKTKSDEETMLVEATIIKDTGPHIENKSIKGIAPNNITSNIYYKFGTTEHLSFGAYKFNDIYRTIEYSYKFHEGTEYYGNIKNGNIKKSSNVLGDYDYRTLSTYTEYTNLDSTISAFYNHNYPVQLNALAGDYKVDFKLTKKDILEKINDFTGKYECSYEVTNDLVVLEDKNLDVLFRSVATNKLDPNNRYENNKFGENWITKKGTQVKKIIELNAENETNNTSKNTYHPNNLEYSFTLTPSLINAIQEYNEDHKYSEYKLTCNNAGMQCQSEFLTQLAEGKVNSVMIENNYNDINDFDISSIRNEWKYYLLDGSSLGCNQINAEVNNIYVCPYNLINTTEKYNNQYRLSGVLP